MYFLHVSTFSFEHIVMILELTRALMSTLYIKVRAYPHKAYLRRKIEEIIRREKEREDGNVEFTWFC